MDDLFIPFHLSLAECRGNKKNTIYPNRVEIQSAKDLEKAVLYDHIAGMMKDNIRGKGRFLGADVLMLDLDNGHSEDPTTWKGLADIEDALQGVQFYAVRSRNYMKEKKRFNPETGETIHYQAREKYHLYFPLGRMVTDEKEYQDIIMKVIGLFPYFDTGAADTARFFFGVSDGRVITCGGEG